MSGLKNEMEALATEIFELTGQKVEFNDPVIVAALFQSRLLTLGYQEGVAALKFAATDILGDVKELSESEKEKIKFFRESQNLAIRQSSEMVRALIKAELPKLRREFYETAAEVICEIDRSVISRKTKAYLVVASIVTTIAFLAGIFVGSEVRGSFHSLVRFHQDSRPG